ncbi:DinB family protein [Fluviicola sp.]|uniref:DinB family protein n=1 Tax=Fluviicola sp. TaxID=1917219 RepID=UPI0031D4886F
MEFSLDKSLEIIANTPVVISTLLHNLSDDWTDRNEGENTWTVKEVVAHLIECEQTNWLPRIRIVLNSPETVFAPMDMQAHMEQAKNHSLGELLVQFDQLRANAIRELKQYDLKEEDFLKTATHPVIGKVSLVNLISTWTAHDMTHLAQIARIIARQNKELVGNFKQYLNILN